MEDKTNMEIALRALYSLGGAQHWIHIEDVALKCYELAPKKFSWKKYPSNPDIQPARFALEAAAKPAQGELVRGNSKVTGWMLTPAGVDAAKRLLSGSKSDKGISRPRRVEHREVDKFLNMLENHKAYQKFLKNRDAPDLDLYELADLIRCPVDGGPAIFNRRLETLMTMASDAQRNGLVDFLSWCKQRFHYFLSGTRA